LKDNKVVEITVDTDEMTEYLFANLVKRGLVPSNKEVEVISDIVFDFLIHKEIIEEEV
jgi:hypothetical protein